MSDPEYTLYYWPISGRGEYARLMFVEAGVPFKDVENSEEVAEQVKQGGLYKATDGGPDRFPVQFPPVIKKGDFLLGQTPVICKYLGTQLGLLPETEVDRWHAEQLLASIFDFVSEGRLAFHGVRWIDSYFNQVEETKSWLKWFGETRLQTWLTHFEAALKANKGGKGFLFGDKLCYVDLVLMQSLRACENSYPDPYKAADYCPLLKEFRTRMEGRQRLAAYIKSDKCRALSGNSMM